MKVARKSVFTLDPNGLFAMKEIFKRREAMDHL